MIIDGLQFARNASVLSGQVKGAQLTRLAALQCRTPGLQFKLLGTRNERGKLALELHVKGELQLTCQRCLQPLVLPLAVENELELSSSIEEIEAAEDDVDRVLAARDMDVFALVEDEAILALPMIPRHERCEAAGGIAAGQEKAPSPFEALAVLKQRPKR